MAVCYILKIRIDFYSLRLWGAAAHARSPQPAARSPQPAARRLAIARLTAICTLATLGIGAAYLVNHHFGAPGTRAVANPAAPEKPKPVIHAIALPDGSRYHQDRKKAGHRTLFPDWTPAQTIEHYQGKLVQAKSPLDAGNAICCLSLAAFEMSRLPDHRKAAMDVISQAVMPNLPLCQPGSGISSEAADCWFEALGYVRATQEALGDEAGELQTLDLMRTQAATADQRAMATYFKARHYAKRKNYPLAIQTMETIEPNTPWSKDRDPFIASWRKSLAKLEAKRPSPPQSQHP